MPWEVTFVDAEPPKVVMPPQEVTKPPIEVMPIQASLLLVLC